MARKCNTCRHPKVGEVDKKLIDGVLSLREISKCFGLTVPGLWRHKQSHLPAVLARGKASLEAGEKPANTAEAEAQRTAVHAEAVDSKRDQRALDSWQQLKAINAASLEVLRTARKQGQSDVLLRAVDRIARQIELEAKLLGQIQDGVIVNVAVLPEWQGLRHRILESLRDYPEARLAVVAALKDAGP